MNNRKLNFSVTMAADTAEIFIYDVIGDGFFGGVSAKMVADELAKLKSTKQITVHINSPGGSAFDGVAIYNQLKNHKATIDVEIDGLAASAASVIAMAGDSIAMAENAMMMIHEASSGVWGKAADMRAEANLLEKINVSIVDTYTARTGNGADEVTQMMADETWFSAAEAVEKGFATEVNPAKRAAACAGLDRMGFKRIPEVLTMTRDPEEEKRAEWAAYKAEIEALRN